MARVAPDVQALVQAAISRRGPAAELISSWERGETTLITCEEIVMEYEGVLRRPHIMDRYAHITNKTIAASAAALRTSALVLNVRNIPSVVSADLDDDIVVACAVAGSADYIVSRDRHFLGLGTYHGIPIVSTEAFARILRGQVSEPLILPYAAVAARRG